jgi:hypothetical protein
MKDDDYPRNAIIIELLFGWIFGAMGIGHIYAGNFYSGIFILVFYIALLIIEVLVMLALIIPTMGMVLIPAFIFINIQNLIFSIISIYAIKKQQSSMFARLILCVILLAVGFFSIILFSRSDQKEIGFGIFFTAMVLCLTVMIAYQPKNETNNGDAE